MLNALGKVFKVLGSDRRTDRETALPISDSFNKIEYFAKGGVSGWNGGSW